MFCPNCKTEYRDELTRCADCGAQLVSHLETPVPTNRPPSNTGPELLWTGSEAALYGAITRALEDAGIPCHSQTRNIGLLPGLSQPVYALFIPALHHDAAHAAMAEAQRQIAAGEHLSGESADDSADDATDQQEEDETGDPAAAPDFPAENYDPEEATAEVWTGDDADTKDMVVASLRENGIGCEIAGDANFQIRVMPESEARAREIVREISEATPPQ